MKETDERAPGEVQCCACLKEAHERDMFTYSGKGAALNLGSVTVCESCKEQFEDLLGEVFEDDVLEPEQFRQLRDWCEEQAAFARQEEQPSPFNTVLASMTSVRAEGQGATQDQLTAWIDQMKGEPAPSSNRLALLENVAKCVIALSFDDNEDFQETLAEMRMHGWSEVEAAARQAMGVRLWQVISPDDLPITQRLYASREEAERALAVWVERYQQQGYYKTAEGERIPMGDIARRCTIHQQPEVTPL